jgi:hypothetical protein
MSQHQRNPLMDTHTVHPHHSPIPALTAQIQHVTAQAEKDKEFDRKGVNPATGKTVDSAPPRHMLNAWERGDLVPPTPPKEHFITPLTTAHILQLNSHFSKRKQATNLFSVFLLLLLAFIFIHALKL